MTSLVYSVRKMLPHTITLSLPKAVTPFSTPSPHFSILESLLSIIFFQMFRFQCTCFRHLINLMVKGSHSRPPAIPTRSEIDCVQCFSNCLGRELSAMSSRKPWLQICRSPSTVLKSWESAQAVFLWCHILLGLTPNNTATWLWRTPTWMAQTIGQISQIWNAWKRHKITTLGVSVLPGAVNQMPITHLIVSTNLNRSLKEESIAE